jgi:hypothetical protein
MRLRAQATGRMLYPYWRILRVRKLSISNAPHIFPNSIKIPHNKGVHMKSTTQTRLSRFNNERCTRANFSDKGAVIERFRSILGL